MRRRTRTDDGTMPSVQRPGDAVAAELLDVVDASNQVIGVATRGDVHAHGWWHRAVHIVIEDGAGRMYLQRRAENKDCDPGLWDTAAAGHVDHGEEYLSAALRELGEELALHDVQLERVGALPASAATGYEFVQVYRGRATREPQPNTEEIATGGWWTVHDIAAWLARSPQQFTATFGLLFVRFCAPTAAVRP